MQYRSVRAGFWQDYQNAFDLASWFCSSPEAADAFLNYLFFRTRDLIDTRWPEVEAVAESLVIKRTLHYADAVTAVKHPMNAIGD